MARYYLGYATDGPRTFRNVGRHETGEPQIFVNENEAKKLTLDFADWLEGTETISSCTATTENCTCSVTVSSPSVILSVSASVSYTYGRIILTTTSSTGEIRRDVIRVRRANRYTDEVKYRDYT